MTDNLKGILAILTGSAAFVVNDAIVKLLTVELASGEIIVVRGAMATTMLSAVCQLIANTFIIYALRTGEIAVVAPFRYVAAPLAILIGWWWWGDVPDALAWVGIALVIAAGLYTLHRERHGLTARAAVPSA